MNFANQLCEKEIGKFIQMLHDKKNFKFQEQIAGKIPETYYNSKY